MFLSIGPRSRGRSRVRFHQIAGAALVFFVMLSVLRMARRARSARSPQRSIYDYTEGKTTTPATPAPAEGMAGEAITAAAPSSPEGEMSEYLRELVNLHGLTQEITFYARRIRPDFKAQQKRESMTVVRKKFGPRHGFASLRATVSSGSEDEKRHELKRGSQQQQHQQKHQQKQQKQPLSPAAAYTELPVLQLPLPGPPELPDQVDASALLFGIVTTYSRLVASNASLLHDWSRWLTDGRGRSNGAGLFLVLHRASTSEVGHVSSKLRELGIDATVRSSSVAAGAGAAAVGGSSPDNDGTWSYLELVGRLALKAREIFKETEGTKRKKRKYLGLVDDDIFFPSMHRLLARLGEIDPAESAYVGLPSEQADWTTTEGGDVTMTYGGGAVFLTRPMADIVSKLPCARQPKAPEQKAGINGAPPEPQTAAEEAAATTGQWDERLYRCIAAHHSSRLRIMPSLYAPDEDTGDGGYESGLRPLTLHHYRQRHQRFAPSRAHLIASLTGEGSFLQRFFFRGDGWVLVNGHSIAEYPDGVDVVPVSRVSGQKKPPSALLVTQQPHEIIYNNKEKMRDNIDGKGLADVRLASRITIDSDTAQKQERKDQRVVLWTGVKRVWRHLDSRIVRDEAGTVKKVWQAYVKPAGETPEYDDDMLDPSDTVHRQDGVSDLNSVIVLIWEISS
ncbi:hypothetical protein PG996_010402 [Apiospora saccharicola]|uniref:Glycosyltransferase family 31 protein n=1 Tax=Apiospora saccharicola TaxID=335842 RepID=A0ABR1UP47_9PEZI